MKLDEVESRFIRANKEIITHGHVGYCVVTEKEQNSSYECSFLVSNKAIGEYKFSISISLSSNHAILKNTDSWEEQVLQEVISIDRTIQYFCSSILTTYFLFPRSLLTCREDFNVLEKYRNLQSINIQSHPSEWVKNNAYFARLEPRRFYSKLLNYVCDKRGLFLKVWDIEPEKNYFNTSVNSGIPITKKWDEIHEWTFMMHDLFHFLFLDPLLTGYENSSEKQLYIIARMMGEACTLVLADMVSIDHSGVSEEGYDTWKRKIFPLFQSTNLNSRELLSIKKLMFANCIYCLFGDDSEWIKLGASRDRMDDYKAKYRKFFSGDFLWNELNVKCIYERFKKYPKLLNYFQHTDFPPWQYTVKQLSEKIQNNGFFSFESLFEIFWSQFDELINYPENFSILEYRRSVALKYLSGQLMIRYLYEWELQDTFKLEEFDHFFSKRIKHIKNSKDSDEVNNIFIGVNTRIAEMINLLWEKGVLLPHQKMIYNLHVPHFDPIYVGYDRGDEYYEPLDSIANRLVNPVMVREWNKIKPIKKTTQILYNELL
jgi:hypothetical protein